MQADPEPDRNPDRHSRQRSALSPRRVPAPHLFQAGAGVRGPDRRSSPRLAAVEYRAWLGWWVELDFAAVAVRLVNVSRGGTMIAVAEPPPADQPVWMRLVGPASIAAVEADVLEVRPAETGADYVVRLQFADPCPDGFYEAAVLGLGASESEAADDQERALLRLPVGAGQA